MARRIRHFLWVSLLALLGTVVLVLIGARIWLATSSGREFVRVQVNDLVSEALEAKFAIGSIEEVGLTGARVSNVQLHSMQGAPLASVSKLRATINPLALIGLHIQITSARIEQPWVDLGAPADEGGGLIGLFDKPTDPEEEPSGPSSISVALHDIELVGAHVKIKLANVHWTLHGLDAVADVDAADELRIGVQRLSTAIDRNAAKIAKLALSDAVYASTGEAGGNLVLDAGATQLSVRGKLGETPLSGAQRIDAEIKVTQVSAETLASVGLEVAVLKAPVDLHARASGKLDALKLESRLRTPGGDVQIDGSLRDKHVTLLVATEKLEPQRFLDAEIEPLAVRLRAQVDLIDGFDVLDAHAEIDRATYAAVALPVTLASAHYDTTKGVTLHELDARYGDDTRLSARGTLAPDGALDASADVHVAALASVEALRKLAPGLRGKLDTKLALSRSPEGRLSTKVNLTLAGAAYQDITVDTLSLDAAASGADPEHLKIETKLRATRVKVADQLLPQVNLDVSGGPKSYEVQANLGKRGDIHVFVDHIGERWSGGGELAIAVRENDWARARFTSFSYAPDGPITLRGLHARYRDASVKVDGELSEQSNARLRARIDVPDARVLSKSWVDPPLLGSLHADATLEGHLERPRVTLDAQYRTPALAGFKNIVVAIQANADAATRKITLSADARANRAQVKVDVASELWGRGLDLAALQRGTHDVKLDVVRLPLTELEAWPKAMLGTRTADLVAQIHAHGKLEAPEVDGKIKTTLQFEGDEGPLQLALALRYQSEVLRLDLNARDSEGDLVRSHVQTKLEHERMLESPQDGVLELITEREWDAALWIGARRIEQLPGIQVLQLDPALLPVKVNANISLEHKPGTEPEVLLVADAIWPRPSKHSVSTLCGQSTYPHLHLEAKMKDGALNAKTDLKIAGRHVLSIDGNSKAPLDQWFRPTKPQPVNVKARFADLRLNELPMVCESVDGKVSGTAELDRGLTQLVTTKVDLHAEQLRWGKGPAFDARVSAKADRDALVAEAKLKAANGLALITGRLPLDAGGRMPTVDLDAPAELRVKLQKMDVRALLGPVAAVSARSGTLDGEIVASGALLDPSLRGELRLENVSIVMPELGQPLERMTGKLMLDGKTVRLSRTRVHDRDGYADITAELKMSSLQSWVATAQVVANDMPVRRSGVMIARMNGKIDLKAQIEALRTQLDIALRKATIELTGEDLGGLQTLSPHEEIVFTDLGQSEIEEREKDDGSVLLLNIDASEPFWMRREDFSVLVSARMRIQAQNGEASVSGTVDIERGVIELLGQMFDIDEGHIELAGGHEVEPTLDLRASRRIPGGGKVTIAAEGSLREPKLTFFLDDAPVTAGEALAAATGTRTSDDGGSSVQQEVSSAATGIAAGVLTLGARRELGEWVPLLAFEQGGGETRVRAGVGARRLIPKFMRKVVVDAYVEGIVSQEKDQGAASSDSGSQTGAAVLLELRFPYNLVGETQYGPNTRWSVDLGWEP